MNAGSGQPRPVRGPATKTDSLGKDIAQEAGTS